MPSTTTELRNVNAAYRSQMLMEKLAHLYRSALPHARMELGKARKHGNQDKVATWERELDRLLDLHTKWCKEHDDATFKAWGAVVTLKQCQCEPNTWRGEIDSAVDADESEGE